MKKQLKKVLRDNVKTMVTYQSKKLAKRFPVKNKIDFQHQDNVVYYGKWEMGKHSRQKLRTHVWEHDVKLY